MFVALACMKMIMCEFARCAPETQMLRVKLFKHRPGADPEGGVASPKT